MHTGAERAAALTLAAFLLAAPLSAADYSWPVVRVVDGDTVKVDASADMPPELASIAIRLRGVDTPEKGRWACSTASGDQYACSYHAAIRSRSVVDSPNRANNSRTLSSCVVTSGMRRLRK